MGKDHFFYGLLAAVVMIGVLSGADIQNVAKVGEAAPDFELIDADGKSHRLSEFEGKYIVLEWTNFQCPFVRKHYDTGNMQKLQTMFRKKGVVWLSICSSAPGNQGYFEGDDLKRRLIEEKTQATAYLLDKTGKVGRQFGAKTTPHMFIIDPEGNLIYAGAIDDKASTRKEHVAAAENYVAKVLNYALSGKESPMKATSPYGCSVKY